MRENPSRKWKEEIGREVGERETSVLGVGRETGKEHSRETPPPHAGELEPLTALPGQVNRGIGAGMRGFSWWDRKKP